MLAEDTFAILNFLVSLGILIVSIANLLVLGFLSWMALQYTKKSNEEADFEIERCLFQNNKTHLSVELKNTGDGKGSEIKIEELKIRKNETEGEHIIFEHPISKYNIEPDETVVFNFRLYNHLEDYSDVDANFQLFAKIDGVPDVLMALPDDFVEEDWRV